jgi:hypothetical protein
MQRFDGTGPFGRGAGARVLWNRARAVGAIVLVCSTAGAVALLDCADGRPSVNQAPAPSAPPIPHGAPNEQAGQMCVVCHTCGDDATLGEQAPIIDRTHDVCNACHAADGAVMVHGEAGCQWQMDCEAVPPQVNCNDCHSVGYVNDLCEACHQEQCS